MGILFDGVADVERTFGLDITHVRALPECDTVHHIVRFIVNQFQFDMFLVASHHFTRPIIIDMMCTENGLYVVGPEGIELFQVIEEFGRNIPEVNLGININDGTGLFRQDML